MTLAAPVLVLATGLPVAHEDIALAADLAREHGTGLVVVTIGDLHACPYGDPLREAQLDAIALDAMGMGVVCETVVMRSLAPLRALERAAWVVKPCVTVVAAPVRRGGRRLARKLARRLSRHPMLVWHCAAV